MGRRAAAGEIGDREISGEIGDWEISGDDGAYSHAPGDVTIGDDALIDFGIGEEMSFASGGEVGDHEQGAELVIGADSGMHYAAGAPGPGDVVIGVDEDAETDQDIADLNEFAASAGAWEGIAMLGDDLGAFEGLAWAADRLGVHSMAERPNEMSARDALLDGRQGQAARFPM
jgi:hypothetical protein